MISIGRFAAKALPVCSDCSCHFAPQLSNSKQRDQHRHNPVYLKLLCSNTTLAPSDCRDDSLLLDLGHDGRHLGVEMLRKVVLGLLGPPAECSSPVVTCTSAVYHPERCVPPRISKGWTLVFSKVVTEREPTHLELNPRRISCGVPNPRCAPTQSADSGRTSAESSTPCLTKLAAIPLATSAHVCSPSWTK